MTPISPSFYVTPCGTARSDNVRLLPHGAPLPPVCAPVRSESHTAGRPGPDQNNMLVNFQGKMKVPYSWNRTGVPARTGHKADHRRTLSYQQAARSFAGKANPVRARRPNCRTGSHEHVLIQGSSFPFGPSQQWAGSNGTRYGQWADSKPPRWDSYCHQIPMLQNRGNRAALLDP